MNLKSLVFGILICILFGSFGCESWLDVQPEDRVTDEQLFSDVQGFRTALNGIYVELSSGSLYGGDLLVDGVEVLAQRYDFSDNTSDISRLCTYNYTTDYAKNKFEGVWEKAYSLIANCNKLLEYADKKQDILIGDTRDLIIGEAKALRAFLHFDLLRLFGPIYATNFSDESIPYNVKYSISATSLLPANEVVEKILADLDEAEHLLENVDPIIEFGPQNSDSEDGLNYDTFRTQRLNYYAVKALKARVYLYAGNTEEAYKEAKAVVAVQEQWFPWTPYQEIMGGTKAPDRIFSSELLFSTYNNSREDIFTKYFSPELDPAVVYAPKDNLDGFFVQERDKDYRYNPIWLSATSRDYKCFHKYENVDTDSPMTHLVPLIRISEMFYIIAETATDEREALAALNTVLYNRGLTELEDGNRLSETIAEEYKREFWGEGQLFFYYKRKNVPSLYSYTAGEDIEMDATKYVVPLPLSETDFR